MQTTPHILTPEQLRALETLKEFILDPGQQVFILQGYAGTGKTTLMASLIGKQDPGHEKANDLSLALHCRHPQPAGTASAG